MRFFLGQLLSNVSHITSQPSKWETRRTFPKMKWKSNAYHQLSNKMTSESKKERSTLEDNIDTSLIHWLSIQFMHHSCSRIIIASAWLRMLLVQSLSWSSEEWMPSKGFDWHVAIYRTNYAQTCFYVSWLTLGLTFNVSRYVIRLKCDLWLGQLM